MNVGTVPTPPTAKAGRGRSPTRPRSWRGSRTRKKEKIGKKSELRALGVRMDRAEPFLMINGRHSTTLDRWLS
jgi:hypothetical protein